VSLLARDPESEVLIFGAISKRSSVSASVPLYAGLIARALGAPTVLFVDARAHVRAHADRLGLTALAPADLRGLPPAALVVDVSGSARGLRTALSHTAQDGICTSSGGLHNTARIPTGLLFGRNATLHLGRTHARAIIPKVLALIVAGRLAPQAVTTHLAPLDDAPRALREHVSGEATKTILTET
jgi:alcohol dehydrogenase